MKLLLDHNLSFRIAHSLHAIVSADGHEVAALREKFDPATTDEEWISALGIEGGWAVLSGDVRITRNPAERAAWRRTDLVGFFLQRGWRKLRVHQQAAHLLLWWPRLVEQYGLVRGGALFELPVRSTSKFRQLNF